MAWAIPQLLSLAPSGFGAILRTSSCQGLEMITQVGRELQHLSAWEPLSEIFFDKNKNEFKKESLFAKLNFQITNKYMKKLSISRNIREVQINTMM